MIKFIFTNFSSALINLFFLIFLIVGIQNSYENKKVIFLNYESVEMPISFIIGTSFITGSLLSNFIFSLLEIEDKKN